MVEVSNNIPQTFQFGFRELAQALAFQHPGSIGNILSNVKVIHAGQFAVRCFQRVVHLFEYAQALVIKHAGIVREQFQEFNHSRFEAFGDMLLVALVHQCVVECLYALADIIAITLLNGRFRAVSPVLLKLLFAQSGLLFLVVVHFPLQYVLQRGRVLHFQ